MVHDINKYFVGEAISIVEAMRLLGITAEKVLFVVRDENIMVGTLTDGDIRRWLLAGGGLQDPVEKICNVNPVFMRTGYDGKDVRHTMLVHRIESIPVIDHDRRIKELLFWNEVFDETEERKSLRPLSNVVVIMAGGKGTRLDPFTRILPKPLIPIGNKTIIEVIIDKFRLHQICTFYVSVNVKSRIIKSYFEELDPDYSVHYIHEPKPLGTAGSLKYLEGKISGNFLVTNCDIIINTDYAELMEHHEQNENDITLVASMKQYRIPYGVCNMEKGGILKEIVEKPTYDLLVNTGMYVINSDLLSLIGQDEFLHMTHLIDRAREHGKKTGIYPVGEKEWIDTGEWEEYKNALKVLNLS